MIPSALSSSCVLLAGVFVAFVNCGTDPADEESGFEVGALEGRYDLTGFVDRHSKLSALLTPECALVLGPRRADLLCEKSDGDDSESLDVRVQITEDKVAAEIFYKLDRGADYVPECYVTYNETFRITANALRNSRDETAQGLLSPVAGTWEGQLRIDAVYNYELREERPRSCVQPTTALDYAFDADVAGRSAIIRYSRAGVDITTVDLSAENESVTIAGEEFPKEL